MSASMHPTIEQIADHEAGLSSVDDARWITEHLDSCGQCGEAIARLAEVTDLLADAGTDIPEIPDDVADQIDRALATAAVERAAGVPSLSERRAGSSDSSGPDTSTGGTGTPGRRGRWVLGAAAAVAVVAIGAAVTSNGLPGPSSEADSAASGSTTDNESAGAGSSGSGQVSGEAQNAPGGQDFGTGAGRTQGQTPELDSGNVSLFARELSRAKVNNVPSVSRARCESATDQDVSPTSGDGALDALVKFEGNKALLRIQRDRRLLTVYACPGPTRVLYRSTY